MRLSKHFIRSLFTSTAWWLGVATSFLLFFLVSQVVEAKLQAQFEHQVSLAKTAIETRVASYVDVLRGAAALFSTSDNITREQFRSYVRQLELERTFPGITNLNFTRRVYATDKAAFEAAVQHDTSTHPLGYPGFSIRPAGDRQEYHVVTYIEPMETNMVSFGFDVAAAESGHNAVDIGRDSGKLMSSGRLLHISGPFKHVGLSMRLPLYHRGMPLDTVEDRRAAYFGTVGAGFDINKLMEGAINRTHVPHLGFRIFDAGRKDGKLASGTTDPSLLLYDSNDGKTPTGDKPALHQRVPIEVGPRVWEADFQIDKSLIDEGFEVYIPGIVLVLGLLASALLFSINYSQNSARRRAIELAREMTKDLRASQANLAEAQQMASLGSWTLDGASKAMNWSAETFHILGMERFSDAPDFNDFLRRLHDDDRSRVLQGLERCLQNREAFNAEHRIRRRDGPVRWVQTIARPGPADGPSMMRGTIMDITERKQTVEALKRSQELLRELTAHQDRVKEEERRRIAREIHDELGQTLLALRIDVSMLEARTAKGHPRLNQKVRGALNQIDATVKTIRTIINNLRPAVLDLGLTAAIEWQVAEFRRRSGITCDLEMSDEEFDVDDARATTLFRILQESLTNVIRHAKASHVLIELEQHDKQLVMKIRDNGIGIAPGPRKGTNSFGLVGVEERIHALNGRFIIDSAPGCGTTLSIFIPLEPQRERRSEPEQIAG
ncbi:sensor histidine kinase [Noviherbaspirillum galbum]|uniref:PAS domain-containing protein n=1 Tax=Noviherbaspirillum galbum TaxID=2709383 RepID=A0A6B3SV60_9BURK|nr:CHASE domain-containing protein [Noviherbaspirillum galbum]NEX64388.1 PAS domain-containing protein [Noviherbaspirillum galbum]